MAWTTIWEFTVPPANAVAFEAAYGPSGDWARLFLGQPGYLGTRLLRDLGDPTRFVTLDSWTSDEHFAEFLSRHGAEYHELDRVTEGLATEERHLGSLRT